MGKPGAACIIFVQGVSKEAVYRNSNEPSMKEAITKGSKKITFFVALVLLVPIGLTYFAWRVTADNLYESQKEKFERLAHENEKALLYRIDSYHQALLGAKGFYQGSNNVERHEWRAYMQAIDVLNRFPGIDGIGTVYDVAASQEKKFVERAKADGYPAFTIHPQGKFLENFIVKFIEPASKNYDAIGLNLGFEENRRAAAMMARDTGKATITNRIILVQDAEKKPGFILFLPIYANSELLETVEQRRKDFLLWLYAPFIGENFMHKLTESQGKTLHLKVYDSERVDEKSLFYDSDIHGADSNPIFVSSKKVEIMGKIWLLVWSSTEIFERAEESNEPLLMLLAGLMSTGLFAVFVVIMTIRAGYEQYYSIKNYLVPVAVFLMIVFASYYIQKEMAKKEISFIQESASEASDAMGDAINNSLESRFLALGRMAQRWDIRDGTPFVEWLQDAESYVHDQPGLEVVRWVDNDYKTRWIEPLEPNESDIGLSIFNGELAKETILNSISEKKMIVTPPVKSRTTAKFTVYFPLHKEKKPDGLIAGGFDIARLINSAIYNLDASDFVLCLKHEGIQFYCSQSASAPENKDWRQKRIISVGSEAWEVLVYPKKKFIDDHTSFLPYLVFAIGIIFAIAIALLIDFSQRSQQKTVLLAEKEDLLSSFVEHTPAAVAMFDTEVKYIAASKRWYKDYGLEGRDIIGLSHYDIFPDIPEKHPEWIYMQQRAIEGEVIREEEEYFSRPDGGGDWLRYELRPWKKGSDEPGGFIMFTENITERKHIQVMKDEFISTVNHELRTPLTSIQGSLGLLKAKLYGDLDSKGKRLLDLSYDNCYRLAHLVNDILDMEKISAGKVEYDLGVYDIVSLVLEVIDQHQSYADNFNVNIVLKSEVEAVYCRVDSNRFNQALVNLISNAVKFSPRGDAVIVSIEMKGATQVRLVVEDNGPGIPEDFRDRVFDKFAQADSSSTRTRAGTGLGLNITKSLIEAFEGSVYFESEVGKGTRFYFVLPIVIEEKYA